MKQLWKKPSFWLIFIFIIESFYFIDLSVRYSYINGFYENLKGDTKFLVEFVPKDITQKELIQFLKDKFPTVKPHIFKSVVTIKGIKFIFNEKDELQKIEHWLANNSPLYEKIMQ